MGAGLDDTARREVTGPVDSVVGTAGVDPAIGTSAHDTVQLEVYHHVHSIW